MEVATQAAIGLLPSEGSRRRGVLPGRVPRSRTRATGDLRSQLAAAISGTPDHRYAHVHGRIDSCFLSTLRMRFRTRCEAVGSLSGINNQSSDYQGFLECQRVH
jgi:hypothetical protein